MDEHFDAVVVGAGPAGCAAATLLARDGWNVALLDRGVAPHPRLCTHAIMPSGLPVLATIGVLEQVESAGAQAWWGVRLLLNGVEIRAPLPDGWSEYPHGLSLRRHLLDPILLDAVRAQRSAVVHEGWSAEALLGDRGIVTGVRVRDTGGARRRIGARLVVAADGRRSRLVRSARLPERVLPNRHAALIAYIDGVPQEERPQLEGFYGRGRSASMLPADCGLRVVGVMAPADRWPRSEWPARMMAELRGYPGMACRLRRARLVTPPTPVRGLRNLLRTPTRPGFAAIGDAAIQTDPAFGQGISWALRAGERLAQSAGAALRTGSGPVTMPRRFAWEPAFLPLFLGISALSALAPGSILERLVAASAAGSPITSAAALRLALGFATTPRHHAPLRTATSWLRGAIKPAG